MPKQKKSELDSMIEDVESMQAKSKKYLDHIEKEETKALRKAVKEVLKKKIKESKASYKKYQDPKDLEKVEKNKNFLIQISGVSDKLGTFDERLEEYRKKLNFAGDNETFRGFIINSSTALSDLEKKREVSSKLDGKLSKVQTGVVQGNRGEIAESLSKAQKYYEANQEVIHKRRDGVAAKFMNALDKFFEKIKKQPTLGVTGRTFSKNLSGLFQSHQKHREAEAKKATAHVESPKATNTKK